MGSQKKRNRIKKNRKDKIREALRWPWIIAFGAGAEFEVLPVFGAGAEFNVLPVFDAGADFEEESEWRRRVPRKLELEHLTTRRTPGTS